MTTQTTTLQQDFADYQRLGRIVNVLSIVRIVVFGIAGLAFTILLIAS